MLKQILKSALAVSALITIVPVANAQYGPMVSNRFGNGVVMASNVSYYNNTIGSYNFGNTNYQTLLRQQLMVNAGNRNVIRPFPADGSVIPLSMGNSGNMGSFVQVVNPGNRNVIRPFPADGTAIPLAFSGGNGNLGSFVQFVNPGNRNVIRPFPSDGTAIPLSFSRGATAVRAK